MADTAHALSVLRLPPPLFFSCRVNVRCLALWCLDSFERNSTDRIGLDVKPCLFSVSRWVALPTASRENNRKHPIGPRPKL